MGDFDYIGFLAYCKKHKILKSIEYDGIVVETDEENPKAVAYIPQVVSGIIPAPGYRVRISSSAMYQPVKAMAELMAPGHLRRFEAEEHSLTRVNCGGNDLVEEDNKGLKLHVAPDSGQYHIL